MASPTQLFKHEFAQTPGDNEGQGSLACCSPRGRKELDTDLANEQQQKKKDLRWFRVRHGEGDGTPLQYSRLENPRDGGAWWAAVRGVAESWTRLSDFTFTFTHWRRKWQPTPVFLPGKISGNGGAWWAAVYGVTQSRTRLK